MTPYDVTNKSLARKIMFNLSRLNTYRLSLPKIAPCGFPPPFVSPISALRGFSPPLRGFSPPCVGPISTPLWVRSSSLSGSNLHPWWALWSLILLWILCSSGFWFSDCSSVVFLYIPAVEVSSTIILLALCFSLLLDFSF